MYSIHRKRNGIYANISLFLFYSEVTVATRIQSVYSPDGGSAPSRDDLYSHECQRRPCQLDSTQRQIPSEDFDDHRHKTMVTRHVLCTIWPMLLPGIKPSHAGFIWPEENWPPDWTWFLPRFFLHFCHWLSFGPLPLSSLACLFGDAWLIAQTLLEESWTESSPHWIINKLTLAGKWLLLSFCIIETIFLLTL